MASDDGKAELGRFASSPTPPVHRPTRPLDALGTEDLVRSNALGVDQSEVAGYLTSPSLLGSCLALAVLYCGILWGFAVPAAVITTINADIGPSDNSSLFSILWTLCVTIMSLIFGRLSDKFGRRPFLLLSCGLGIIGGIVACTAQRMDTLIGANVLIGLSAGVPAVYPLIVGELVPHRLKFVFIPVINSFNMIPVGFGAYLGSAIAIRYNWRVIYYIYIPLMAIAGVLFSIFYHPANFRQLHGPDRTYMQEIKRIDFVGFFFLVTGLTSFLLGVSWGGQPSPWSSPKILGLLIGGAVSLVFWFAWAWFGNAPNPVVPLRLFRTTKGIFPLVVLAMTSGIIYVAFTIMWPTQVFAVFSVQTSDWQTLAWMSTTIGFGTWFGLAFVCPLFGIIKHTKWQLFAYICWITCFIGGLSTIDRHHKAAGIALSFLGTIPVGVLETAPVLLTQMVCDPAELGVLVATIASMRTGSGAIFTSVFVAILSNKTPGEVAKAVRPVAIGAGLPPSSVPALIGALATGNTTALGLVPGATPPIIEASTLAYTDGLSNAYAYVYYACLALCLTGVIAALFVPSSYDNDFTDRITRQVYGKDTSAEDARIELKVREQTGKL